MLMATIFLALLFIAGLLFTLFNFQTKKIMAWFQSLSTKTTSEHVPINPTTPRKAVKSGAAKNKAELKSVFATFDKNNDGFITKQELWGSLKNIGIHMTEKEVADMVEKVDSNGDGLIDLDEFCEVFDSVVGGEGVIGGGTEEEEGGEREGGGEGGDLKEAFDVFDGDGDGLITVEELGLVLSSLGLKEGQRLENCKEMIRKVDMDGDGMVSFDEFKTMMKAGGMLIATC